MYRLGNIKTEKAQSMYTRCKALYTAIVEHDSEAYNIIEAGIRQFPKDKKYMLGVKFDIAQVFNDIEIMQQVITDLKEQNVGKNSIVILESKFIAKQGDVEKAISFFKSNIRFFTNESKDAFCQSLQSINNDDSRSLLPV